MTTFALPLNEVTAARLGILVRDGVREGRQLEYKQSLPGGTDEEKKEFLADVSAFANAAGGDLIYGIEERRDANGQTTGEPEVVVGLPGVNVDQERRRLQSILDAGIEPRLIGVRVEEITRGQEPSGLLIRVPRGFSGLHMIVFKNWSRFYSRHSGGKYQLDVHEIHHAIRAGEDARRTVQRFRAERVARLAAQEGPVVIGAGPKLIFHAIPLGDSDFGQHLLAQPLEGGEWLFKLAPLDGSVHAWNRNLDGLVVRGTERAEGQSYVQVFRDGTVEYVGVRTVNVLESPGGRGALFSDGTGPGFGGYYLERQLIAAVGRLRGLWSSFRATGPMMLALSLTGVKGLRIFPHSDHFRAIAVKIDRDPLLVPETVVDDISKPPDDLLQQQLAMLWQAGGFGRSPH